MRIGHASISENNNNGRDGRAKAGDQTGKEVCIRTYYKKGWQYLLRCKDSAKAEKMAQVCEALANNPCVGYDQSQRLTLHKELAKLNYDYTKLNTACECDCSSFMTACAECAGIFPAYTNGNAPVTANMVNIFKKTGMFDVLTEGINEEYNLRRGDILVGAPNTHTVMVLDNGTVTNVVVNRRTLKRGMSGSDVMLMQQILLKEGYNVGLADGIFGKKTAAALLAFQKEHFTEPKEWDSICGKKTWLMLEQYT
ncbi:MAG: peptidoglycan-binding protein [Bacteroidales bacterium]|nr:peptidoglycan-binding protein [Bacteroidales bacterium]